MAYIWHRRAPPLHGRANSCVQSISGEIPAVSPQTVVLKTPCFDGALAVGAPVRAHSYLRADHRRAGRDLIYVVRDGSVSYRERDGLLSL